MRASAFGGLPGDPEQEQAERRPSSDVSSKVTIRKSVAENAVTEDEHFEPAAHEQAGFGYTGDPDRASAKPAAMWAAEDEPPPPPPTGEDDDEEPPPPPPPPGDDDEDEPPPPPPPGDDDEDDDDELPPPPPPDE